jgi:FtsZ-binding cell division protein ZapB
MGRVADAIEQVENDLEEALEAIEDLKKEIEALKDENDELFKLRNWFEAYDDWIRANYPDAPEIYQALEKLKK